MNPIFATQNPRNGGNRARADRNVRNAVERADLTESHRLIQVKRLCAVIGCTEATAMTLAYLAYGEQRS